MAAADIAIQCRHWRDANPNGVFLHIVSFGPGASANVVSHDPAFADAPIATTPPPDRADFMDGNLVALVRGNHVVFCGKGVKRLSTLTPIGVQC